MNQSEDCVMQGQISIFEILDHDTWSGKMSQERSVPTKARTSELSSKRQQGLRTVMPLFLDLRGDTNGHTQAAYWEKGGALLGDYTMHSFGEYPNEERESLLSQILEDNPHPKYCLSEKACQGILNRAERRGKKLPEQLETALREQVTRLKSGGGREFDSYGKRAGKGALIQKEKSATLGVSQDQTLIQMGKCLNPWDVQSKHIQPENGVAEYLYSGECRGGGGESYVMQEQPILLESNQNHATVQMNGVSTALPASMGEGGGYVPMVVSKQNWDGSQVSPTLTANNANGGQRMPDKDNFNAVITYV